MVPSIPPFPSKLDSLGLYLHVPFCKSLCPFCPYNRVAYEKSSFERYLTAVLQEIDIHAPHLRSAEFSSLYIGGGTPTVDLTGLMRIISHLRSSLDFRGDICIELHPAHMDEDDLASLKEAGVTMLSVGVESTTDELLQRIGRNHSGKEALDALGRARRVGFDTINADLMFALPDQTVDQWRHDVLAVLDQGVDQLSTYPMFTFPYSDHGREVRARSVQRPRDSTIRAMLRFTDQECIDRGFDRCAVWSWNRPNTGKFSSITRHRYLGFGPSAATMDGDHFYVNTFDVDAYADCLPAHRPVALAMEVDTRLEMAYWLYWRVYELFVPAAEFDRLFGPEESLDSRFGTLFSTARAAGMAEKTSDGYVISPAGAYWIHRLQNEYSLNYINRLWGTCRRDPWPAKAVL